jgi:hypothetical protein
MEAKVDIRKLQVLSDRINQATEALNSVRASVHGLGHTTAPSTYGSFGYGVGMQSPMGTVGYGTFNQPSFNQPYGQPYMQNQMFPYGTGFVPGLQHSTGIGQLPYGMSQFSQFPQQQLGMSGYGIGAQSQMIPGLQSQLSPWQSQYSPMMGQIGLQHSTAQQLGQVPFAGQSSFGGQVPFAGQNIGQQQLGQQLGGISPQTQGLPYGVGAQVSPFGMGLQHTSASQQVPVWGSMSQQLPTMQQSNVGISAEIMEQRALEARASDPYRLAQTFPFAFQPQAPVGIW